MQWSGTIPKTGLTPALMARKEQDQIARMVLDGLADDPAFAVRTVDGRGWICPFSGAVVPCAEDFREAAKSYLFQRRPWTTRRGGKPRPLFAVLEQRWTLHLESTTDPHYLSFDQAGRWNNPLTGQAELLPTARGAGDARAVPEIARALAASG